MFSSIASNLPPGRDAESPAGPATLPGGEGLTALPTPSRSSSGEGPPLVETVPSGEIEETDPSNRGVHFGIPSATRDDPLASSSGSARPAAGGLAAGKASIKEVVDSLRSLADAKRRTDIPSVPASATSKASPRAPVVSTTMLSAPSAPGGPSLGLEAITTERAVYQPEAVLSKADRAAMGASAKQKALLQLAAIKLPHKFKPLPLSASGPGKLKGATSTRSNLRALGRKLKSLGLRSVFYCVFPASLEAGAAGCGAIHRNVSSDPVLVGMLAGYSKLGSSIAAASSRLRCSAPPRFPPARGACLPSLARCALLPFGFLPRCSGAMGFAVSPFWVLAPRA